jgi:hypothetical protein
MMTHPNELFKLAKEKMEQNQRDMCLANVQACQLRHWLAERVRYLADRLEPENPESARIVVRAYFIEVVQA